MNLIEAPSPNFDPRTVTPGILVLHYTGMKTGEEAIARLRDPEARVSSHYVVEEDGRVFRLVPEERRSTLVASRKREAVLEWNVILQGKDETVFFDF